MIASQKKYGKPFGLAVSLFFILLTLSVDASGQDTSKVSKGKLIGVPLLFYTPETRLGLGAAGAYTFRFKGEPQTSRPSQFQLAFAYTFEKQILAYLPFQLFFKDDAYFLQGELGYYRYFYKFFGIGNTTSDEAEETFRSNFPRLRVDAYREVQDHFYLGFRYWLDDYDIVDVETDGQLAGKEIPGSEGGTISGIGLLALHDTRDRIFYPGAGHLVKAFFYTDQSWTGSSFSFWKWGVDASRYYALSKKAILALNFNVQGASKETPFFQLPLYGGSLNARGYFEGRYRDQFLVSSQFEYRRQLFWRVGVALFASIGDVSSSLAAFNLQNVKPAIGGGLRIALDQEETINLRIDYGFGINSSGFYITVGEAF